MVSFMVLAPEHVIHARNVEVELLGIFGLDLACLQLDNYVARCPH